MVLEARTSLSPPPNGISVVSACEYDSRCDLVYTNFTSRHSLRQCITDNQPLISIIKLCTTFFLLAAVGTFGTTRRIASEEAIVYPSLKAH